MESTGRPPRPFRKRAREGGCGCVVEERRVIEDLTRLPLQERLRLVEEIWDSIVADEDALRLSDEQRLEFDRRLAGYQRDGQAGRPAQEVIEEIRRRL